jgi:hypothetical protein
MLLLLLTTVCQLDLQIKDTVEQLHNDESLFTIYYTDRRFVEMEPKKKQEKIFCVENVFVR